MDYQWMVLTEFFKKGKMNLKFSWCCLSNTCDIKHKQLVSVKHILKKESQSNLWAYNMTFHDFLINNKGIMCLKNATFQV